MYVSQVTKENFKNILRQAYGSDNSTLALTIFKMFDTDGSGFVTSIASFHVHLHQKMIMIFTSSSSSSSGRSTSESL